MRHVEIAHSLDGVQIDKTAYPAAVNECLQRAVEWRIAQDMTDSDLAGCCLSRLKQPEAVIL